MQGLWAFEETGKTTLFDKRILKKREEQLAEDTPFKIELQTPER